MRFLVTAGHIHNYERFEQNDIVYLVAGGGGGKPRPVQRSTEDLYQDAAFPNYNYVRIVENGDTMEGTMIRLADPDAATPRWEERDHFQIKAVTQAHGNYSGLTEVAFSVRLGFLPVVSGLLADFFVPATL